MPFSLSSMRRLSGAAAAFLAVSALAASPAMAAKKTVSANSVKSVIAYLESKGDKVTEGVSDVGNPMLTHVENYYDVYFDCNEEHKDCTAIQYRACYDNYTGGMEKTNALSRDFFYAKSYIDQDGYSCLELPVATGKGGISYEAMDITYEAFLYFRENADEEFGSGG